MPTRGKHYYILRLPTLAEDEGRTFVEKACNTLEEAQTWVALQKDQYFKPSDYTIVRVV